MRKTRFPQNSQMRILISLYSILNSFCARKSKKITIDDIFFSWCMFRTQVVILASTRWGEEPIRKAAKMLWDVLLLKKIVQTRTDLLTGPKYHTCVRVPYCPLFTRNIHLYVAPKLNIFHNIWLKKLDFHKNFSLKESCKPWEGWYLFFNNKF